MATACSHRRRRRHTRGEHRKRRECCIFTSPGMLMLGIMGLTIALLFRNDNSMVNEHILGGGVRSTQCKSSCNQILQSSASDLPTPLASWAMDALMVIRDEIKGEQGRERDTSKHGSLHRAQRPIHLPPLIKILVGTVDDITVHSGIDVGTIANSHTQGGGKLTSSNDDSTVAFAAAAAAAAVWSETRGRYRMKTLNEEWESALRWIADWGTGDGAQASYKQNGGEGQVANRRNTGHKGKRGRKKGEKTKNPNGTNEKSALLDSCVDKCLSEFDNTDNHYGTNRASLISYLGRKSCIFLNIILLPFPLVNEKHVVFGYFVRFLVSSAYLVVIRVFLLKWLSNSSEHVPEWLVDEIDEDCVDWINSPQQPKKNGARKGKKKKPISRRYCPTFMDKKSCSSSETSSVSTNDSPSKICGTPGLGKQEGTRREDSNINTSENRPCIHKDSACMHAGVKKKPQSHNIKSNEPPQSGNSCVGGSIIGWAKKAQFESYFSSNSNVNSVDHIGVMVQQQKDGIDNSTQNTSRVVGVSRKETKKSPSRKKKQKFTKNSEETSHDVRSDNAKNLDKGCSHHKPQVVDTMNAGKPERESPFHLNGLPVPTNEQREEASRRLREYQSVQIAKLIKKRIQDKVKERDEIVSLYPEFHKEMTLRRGTPHTVWSYTKNAHVPKTVIPPPPGMTWPSDETDETSSRDSEGGYLGDDLLLSNILEDDEDDCPSDDTQPTLSTQPDFVDLLPKNDFQVQVGSERESANLNLLEYKRGVGGGLGLWNQESTPSTYTASWGSSDCSGSSRSSGYGW